MQIWYYLFFFISGVTALIYETAFTRYFGLVFGSTLAAVSAVLAVFMAGMALGAVWLGRKADKMPPLRLYGILEIAAGVCALIAVLLIPVARTIYAHLAHLALFSGSLRLLLQLGLAALLLLPVTLLLGGTLPALVRGLTANQEQRFSRIGLLYGLNTLGAACGTFLCGFLLLELLGYRLSVIVGMGANVAIGVLAILLAPRLAQRLAAVSPIPSPQTANPPRKRASSPAKQTALQASSSLLLWVAGLSGMAALGYEVVWFRILSLTVVADAYAFALMLGIYLLGIGGGSLVAAFRFHRREGTFAELATFEVVLFVLIVAGLAALNGAHLQMARPELAQADFWWKTLINTFLQALILILPATLVLGYIFPLLASLYASQSVRMGSRIGSVIGANTCGAIVGTLGAGFLLIPALGIQRSLLLLGGISALAGLGVIFFGPIKAKSRWILLAVVCPVILAGCLLFPIRPNFGFQQIPTHEKAQLLFYRESADQTVMVTQDLGGRQVRRLLLNQQQATSSSLPGQRKNQLLGHLPLWACPQAHTALVICFGSGGTFGALGLYDLERVDCVEICPSVLAAAPLFRDWNADVLSKPQAHVIIDDGRSFLLTTEEQYDIITLEPMHPGLKGVCALYSREFYQEARQRLNPGGALCQWIPLYSMTMDDARSLMATAVEVFPQSSFWLIGSEGLLLCARDSLSLNWDWLQDRVEQEEIQTTLRRVRLDDPWAILSGYLLGPEGLHNFVAGAPLLCDDRPFLEYSIPRHQHISPWEEMLSLSEQRESPFSLLQASSQTLDSLQRLWSEKTSIWLARDRGYAAYSQGDFPAARGSLEKVLQNAPEDRYAAYFLKEIYWRYGVEFSRRGAWEEALRVYQQAVRIEPQEAEAHFYLAVALDNAGHRQEAVSEIRAALQLDPENTDAKNYLDSRKMSP